MRILILWASDASPNLGVRALARGSHDFLARIWPEAEFDYADFGRRPKEVPWGRARSLVRERVSARLGMQRYLGSFDLVWDTRSGDSFSDIYGLARLTVMSTVHEFARQAGVPVVMAPQTIGPFTTARGRSIARWTLKRSTLVLARDPISAAQAAALGRPVDATASDLAFAIDRPAHTAPGYDVIVNVSGLLWNANSHVDHLAYRQSVRAVVKGLLASGRKVTLLPHVLDSNDGDNDVPTSMQLHKELGGTVALVVPRDLEEARSIISGSGLVVGARMHACLNALSVGVPAIAMAYSRKFEPLLAAIGWGRVVMIDDAAVTASTVLSLAADAALSNRADVSRERGSALLAVAGPLVESALAR